MKMRLFCLVSNRVEPLWGLFMSRSGPSAAPLEAVAGEGLCLACPAPSPPRYKAYFTGVLLLPRSSSLLQICLSAQRFSLAPLLPHTLPAMRFYFLHAAAGERCAGMALLATA